MLSSYAGWSGNGGIITNRTGEGKAWAIEENWTNKESYRQDDKVKGNASSPLGITELLCLASQCRAFACGSNVLSLPFVCGFSARRAQKPHTLEMESTTLPQTEGRSCVRSNLVSLSLFWRNQAQLLAA
jgi:hypothetical protein